MTKLTNWAGNISFESPLERPASVPELQELVAGSEKLRVLGTGHSFNKIADSTGTLVTVADLPKVIEVGESGVTVSAGLRYGEITAALQSRDSRCTTWFAATHLDRRGVLDRYARLR